MKFIKQIIILILIAVAGTLIYTHYDILKEKFTDIYDEIIEYANKNGLDELRAKGYLVKQNDVDKLKDSGITGSDVNINANFYPYYNLLSSEEQIVYKQLYANAKKLSDTFVPQTEIKVEQIKNIVEAVYNDHPEIFWFDTSYGYKYTEDGKCVQITLNFNDTVKNIDNSKLLFESNANRIIEEANKLNTNYEKEKYVHDAINDFVTYDKNASYNQSAYSALVNGRTVCAGYARSFQYIMIELKIPTYYITGDSNGAHAWNIVELSDGYYNVDLTWDDTKKENYTYFNLTDEEISITHTRSSISSNLPSCYGTIYKYNAIDKTGEIIKKIIPQN